MKILAKKTHVWRIDTLLAKLFDLFAVEREGACARGKADKSNCGLHQHDFDKFVVRNERDLSTEICQRELVMNVSIPPLSRTFFGNDMTHIEFLFLN